MRKVEPLKTAPALIKKRPAPRRVVAIRPAHHRPLIETVVVLNAHVARSEGPYEIAKILHGDIMIVTNPALADFRVDTTDNPREAHAMPRVTDRAVPGDGEWRFVQSPPCDYRIYITKNAPDIRVYLLDETGVNHVILE